MPGKFNQITIIELKSRKQYIIKNIVCVFIREKVVVGKKQKLR